MKFYINRGNVLPLPNPTALYTEAVRLEKLFAQQWPYPGGIFTVIYNRAKRCEALLWYYGDQDTSCAIRHKLETFQKNVQHGERFEEIK